VTHFNLFILGLLKQGPIPFSFKHEVNVDDYTSFGDTRVSDEHVSGSYHVQLSDGRDNKNEGNGYVSDVQCNAILNTVANVVEYKEKIDSGFKGHRKAPKKNSSKSLLKVLGKGKCPKSIFYEESSYEKPKDKILTYST